MSTIETDSEVQVKLNSNKKTLSNQTFHFEGRTVRR